MRPSAGDYYRAPDGGTMQVLYFNEACAVCGRAADIHSITINRGEVEPHEFKRCDPPRAAYGAAYWNMSEQAQKDYFRNQLPPKEGY